MENIESFVKDLRDAGSKLTAEQISLLGREMQAKFGINRDMFMLILLSGKQEFKDYMFEETQRLIERGH